MSLRYAQSDVDLFMLAMGQEVRYSPVIPPADEIDLRIDLITEEFDETIAALLACKGSGPSNAHMAEVMDGIADSIYVLLGTATAFGIELAPIWEEVHASNMRKTEGPIRADGKRLKPEGWTGPDVIGAIIDQYTDFDEEESE